MIDYLIEGGQTAVVHVGPSSFDVSKRRRLELADILVPPGSLNKSSIRCRVGRDARIEEDPVSRPVRLASFEPNRAEVPSPWHWKQPALSLDENSSSPRFAAAEIAAMSPSQ